MTVGYTEFSFAYAFTENLLGALAPTGAPTFPNLVQEASLGYDVAIDLPVRPLFFQFKLPALLQRKSAKELKTHGLPLRLPFFRMSLMRRDQSDQHRLLIDLETRFPSLVYYASPRMQNNRSFNRNYLARDVHRATAFVSPAAIGPLPDDKPHTIAYERQGTVGWMCSQPSPLDVLPFEKVLERTSAALDRPSDRFEVDLAEIGREIDETIRSRRGIEPDGLRDAIRERREARPPPDMDARSRGVALEMLVQRDLARSALGVELVFAQPQRPGS